MKTMAQMLTQKMDIRHYKLPNTFKKIRAWVFVGDFAIAYKHPSGVVNVEIPLFLLRGMVKKRRFERVEHVQTFFFSYSSSPRDGARSGKGLKKLT
jgi:hypothetical protein